MRADVAGLLESEQSGVERALVHAQQLLGDVLDVAGQAVAVHLAVQVEAAQHDQVERSLQDVRTVGHAASFRSST